MNDWKIIWNNFCDEVAVSARKNNLEKVFEKGIAKEFFQALEWYRLNLGLQEQYPIKFATATHRADFALFVPDKEKPEIIVELKRPQKKKEEKDAEQLIDYMRKIECSFGILLLGVKLEVYYIDFSKPEHKALLVESIKYQHDNESAKQLMEVLYRNSYDQAKMLDYCHKRVKVNKSVEYWCSADGKAEIMNMIIERSKLPDHLLDTLRSTLVVDVKRKDGLSPVVQQPIISIPQQPVDATPKKANTPGKRESKIWLISASPKFFDHRKCFDELGHIYWKQNNNMQVGDTGYIYFSKPLQKIVFKFEIIACDVPYTEDYNAEKKYYKRIGDYESAVAHNRFYKIIKLGESTSGKLTLNNLTQHGLKQAPLGAHILSDSSSDQLRTYIEENF